MKPRLRRTLITAALIIAAGVVALVAGRHAVVGFVVSRAISAATGLRVTYGSFALGATQSVFNGVRIATAGGGALVDADRITLGYAWREFFGGTQHRYGLRAVDIERPTFTIVRHADGSYNLSGARAGGGAAPAAGGGAAPAAGGGGGPAPWRFALRIRNGSLRLTDQAPVAPDLREQRLGAVMVDAQIASDRRSQARGVAALYGRRTADGALQTWPVSIRGLRDAPRGVAFLTVRAPRFPLRGLVGYIQHSPVMRVDDGLLHGLDVNVFSLNVGLDQAPDVHIGGRADLTDGRLRFASLQHPVRSLHGHLTLTDDGVWSSGLAGTVAGVSLLARGGAYERERPTLRLGVAARGDLTRLRTIFAFSQRQPVSGDARVQTLIEAPISDVLIRTALRVERGSYGAVPLADVAGRIDYHASTVVLDAVHARYGAANLALGGRFLLGGPTLDSAIALAATGPGRALPYAENLAPEARVNVVTVITGGDGYRARGAIGVHGGGVEGRSMFAVDPHGVGEFGPFTFERPDGSSLIGALRLERPTSQSAAWISARGYRVDVPKIPSRLMGLNVPAFPPIAGTIDAALAGGGSPDDFELAGRLSGRELRVGNARLGLGQARIGGNLSDVRLSAIALDGPLGRFRGTASVAAGTFALRGDYDGSLDRLVPLTGNQLAHGAVHGPVLATLGSGNVVVQSVGATLGAASIRGVAVDRAAGTIALSTNTFHLIVADGTIGGRRAVARESQGLVAVSAPDLPSSALRGTGLPLEAGNVSVYGVADLRGKVTAFDGIVAVADGRSHGYRVAGDARIGLVGTHARVDGAIGALGSTFGSIDGAIDGIGERALHYDLDTKVPLGDIGLLRRDLGIPVRHLEGSFAADLHVRGSGTRPMVNGRIEAPEGVLNGLPFRAAVAGLVLDADGVAARNGRLTVGSTQASIAASTGGGRFAVSARALHTDLADFNDYFDAGDTLAGRGRVDLAVRTYGGRIVTRGRIDVRGLRYRDFPLGDTLADWNTNAAAITGQAKLGGPAGTLAARAAIVPANGEEPIRALRDASYKVSATFGRIDLGTWLPAAGYNEPVLGSVDARLHVAGRFPHLAADLDATLNDASVAGYPVRTGRLRATSVGTRANVAEASADLGFAQLAGAGKLGLDPGDPLAFDLRATTGDVGGAIRTFVPAARGLDLGGALATDVRFGGTFKKPTIEGGFDLTGARYGGFAVPRAIGALALAGKAIELRDADVEFTRGQAFVAGSLPLRLQPFGFGPPRAPVSFDVTARSVDLAQFAPLLPAGAKLGGMVDGRFGVEGTVDRPRLLGSLSIASGSYQSAVERAAIQHFNARLVFAGTSVALEAFHADVGSGTLDAGGKLTLPFGATAQTEYALDVRAKAAQLDFPAYGRGTLDGTLRLTGGARAGQPLVAGSVVLRDAVIPVAAVYGSASGSGRGNGKSGFSIDPALRIHAAAANNVRVRNGIVDVGVTGAVDVTGRLGAPQLAGAFTATDGSVSTYNHVFRIVNAAATFNPADGVLPSIDARATARVLNPDPDPSRNIAGSATITVTVSGTPDSNNLQVTYSSDPPYSQEQIVGLLLDVPALLGAVNFNLNGGPGSTPLRGAPGETNALLPPGVTPEQVSAISFNQEVFSLLNGQFTQRALTPVERVFEKIFGLSDLQFTVDYGGGVGYSLRRQIGKRDFAAFLSQTVTYPERSNIGFELAPKPFQTFHFSYYQQNGVTSLITNQTPGLPFSSGSTRRLTSLQPLGNRSGFSANYERRF